MPVEPAVAMHRLAALFLLTVGVAAPRAQLTDTLTPLLQQQYELASDGRALLVKEAEKASFFMLGELHGEN